MKLLRLTLPTVIANALVVGSLGFSGFVGAVSVFAEDKPSEAVRAPSRPVVTTVSRLGASQVVGVRLSKTGTLAGRLNLTDSVSGAHVPAEELIVKFVQRGSIVVQSKPGPGGVFQVAGLSPGAYSMIASGADGMYVSGVVVLPYEANPDVASGARIVDSLQIDATVVHPSNVTLVRKLLREFSKSSPSKMTRQRHVSQVSSQVGEAESDPTPLQTPVLVIDPSGQVRVRINKVDPATGQKSLAVGSTVHLIQRGVVRGKYVVDQDGGFNAQGLVPGQYSLLAISQKASEFAAIGVVVQSSDGNSGTVNKSSRLSVQPAVAKLQDGGNSSIDMAPASDFNSTEEPNQDQPEERRQVDGGGFGGGTGGGAGGGAGGGLGGLGLLGAGAGIAGLAAALANRNNNGASPK